MAKIMNTHNEEISQSTANPQWIMKAGPKISHLIQPINNERTQLYGIENLYTSSGELYSGPMLWAAKHETFWDAVNIATILPKLPQYPFPLKGAMKRDPLSSDVLNSMIRKYAGSVLLEFDRTDRLEGLSQEQKDLLKKQNKERIDAMKQSYNEGYHVGIMVEGTTKSAGDILQSKIKAGAYNLVHDPETQASLVPTVVIGNTVDWMSGPKGMRGISKYIPLVRIGTPFEYEHSSKPEYMDQTSWIKRNIHEYGEIIRNQFIDLNTFNLQQLAGFYIDQICVNKEDPSFTKEDLGGFVDRSINLLGKIKGVEFDKDLLSERKKRRRFKNFYRSLCTMEYAKKTGDSFTVNVERLSEVPGDLTREIYDNNYNSCSRKEQLDFEGEFKDVNILLYSINRIKGISEERSDILHALNYAMNGF